MRCRTAAPLDHLNNSIGVDLAAALTHDEHLQFLEMLPAHEAAVAAAAAAAGEDAGDGMDIDFGGVAGTSGEKRLFADVACVPGFGRALLGAVADVGSCAGVMRTSWTRTTRSTGARGRRSEGGLLLGLLEVRTLLLLGVSSGLT